MLAEERLIRYCAQVDINSSVSEKIKEILSPDLDWAYFFERARAEGVISLIYNSLSEIDDTKSLVPEDIWRRFQSCYYTVAARNTSLCQKLNIVLTSFNQAGIGVILLKGMALIHTVYPNIALRPMYDIDILIHKKDFSMAESKLKELGYTNSPSYPEDFHKDNMMVDVHWDLMNITRVKSRKKSYCIDLDEVWKSSLSLEINGEKARILSPEYCLMDLCLHLTLHHGLQGLVWFIDIARLIEYYKNEIDWNKFIEKSFEYKICRSIYYVLFYVKKVLGEEIPQFVLDRLEPAKQNFLERKVFNLIMSGASLENIRFFLTLLTMENFLDRLAFLREISLPSPKVLSMRYNITSAKSIPQYYFIHFKSILSSCLKLLQKLTLFSSV